MFGPNNRDNNWLILCGHSAKLQKYLKKVGDVFQDICITADGGNDPLSIRAREKKSKE